MLLTLPPQTMRKRAELDRLKAIPIVDVAHALGLELAKQGGGVWGMRNPYDQKDITSLKLFEKSNNWKRFSEIKQGGVSHGSTIDLVMHINECDFKTAVEFLSSHFCV